VNVIGRHYGIGCGGLPAGVGFGCGGGPIGAGPGSGTVSVGLGPNSGGVPGGVGPGGGGVSVAAVRHGVLSVISRAIVIKPKVLHFIAFVYCIEFCWSEGRPANSSGLTVSSHTTPVDGAREANDTVTFSNYENSAPKVLKK
jgi:hypothetical protein